jgi:large subunit ribosomal protein L29
MPIMRLKEIAGMTPEAQEQRLIDLRVELARIRTMVNAGGAVENPARIRELRKTIAQILTIQNEQKLGMRKTPDSSKKEKTKKNSNKDSKEKTSE